MASNPQSVQLKTIYTQVSQRPGALELIDAAVELDSHGKRFIKLESREQAELAAEYRAQAVAQIKRLDEERLETTAGARQTTERINATYAKPIDALQEKVTLVDKALKVWMAAEAEQARLERVELERLAKEAAAASAVEGEEIVQAPLALAPAEKPTAIIGTQGSKTNLRANWKWRVKDIAKVPELYLVPPAERIQKTVMNAAAKAQAKIALAALNLGPNDKVPDVLSVDALPGIELYNEPDLASKVF